MDDNGKVSYYEGGKEIFDESLIRKIKASPDYKAQIDRMNRDRIAEHDKLIDEAKKENDRFINICHLAANVDSIIDFTNQYNLLKPQNYTVPEPTRESVYHLII